MMEVQKTKGMNFSSSKYEVGLFPAEALQPYKQAGFVGQNKKKCF